MQVEPKITTYALLYELLGDDGKGNIGSFGYFASNELAVKAGACINMYPIIRPIERQLPYHYYTDLKEWAKESLTVNQYFKHFEEL